MSYGAIELPVPFQEAMTASMATEIQRIKSEGRNFTLLVGGAAVVLALVIDHFLDRRRMTPNARRGRKKVRRVSSSQRPLRVINLDDPADRDAFLARPRSTRAKKRGRSDFNAARRQYAQLAQRAWKLRAAGRIPQAVALEDWAESVYRSLPKSQKW